MASAGTSQTVGAGGAVSAGAGAHLPHGFAYGRIGRGLARKEQEQSEEHDGLRGCVVLEV